MINTTLRMPPTLGRLGLLLETVAEAMPSSKETVLLEGEVEFRYISRRNTPLRIFSHLRWRHAGIHAKENKAEG